MNLRDVELEFLLWLENMRTDFLTQFIDGINFTGDVLFFTIMLPIIYWLFSKRIGIVLSITIFASLFVNVMLKDIFQVLRPFQAFDLTSTVDQHGYSFPSGHSQHSFVFWTLLSLILKNRWFWLFSITMIVLVGFARMYSGVHFPLDVLGGWLVGLGLVVLFYTIYRKNYLLRIQRKYLIISAIVLPILAILLYEGLTHQALDYEGAYQAGGLVMFGLLGYVLETRYVKFEIKRGILVNMAALVLGLVGLLIIKEGVKVILPDHAWSDFLRYGLLSFWTIYIAPYLFVLTKFAYRKL